jgi:hypothetical protein
MANFTHLLNSASFERNAFRLATRFVSNGPLVDINFDVAVVDASEAETSAAPNAGSASGKPVRRLSADKVEFASLKPGEVRRS